MGVHLLWRPCIGVGLQEVNVRLLVGLAGECTVRLKLVKELVDHVPQPDGRQVEGCVRRVEHVEELLVVVPHRLAVLERDEPRFLGGQAVQVPEVELLQGSSPSQ